MNTRYFDPMTSKLRLIAAGTATTVLAALGVWGFTAVAADPAPIVSSAAQQAQIEDHRAEDTFRQLEVTEAANERAAEEARIAAEAEAARLAEEARIAAEQAAAAEAARVAAEQAAAAQAAQEAQAAKDAAARSQKQQSPSTGTAAPIKCPPGSQANSGDGPNDTSCFPTICFHISLPDPAHPECEVAFKP